MGFHTLLGAIERKLLAMAMTVTALALDRQLRRVQLKTMQENAIDVSVGQDGRS